MATTFDILGLIFGTLGVLASIPVFLAIVLSQLPPQKLRQLDEVLDETETMWRKTLAEGLFAAKPFEEETDLVLSSLRCQTETLRLQTHCATSFFQEFRALLQGLSWNISYVCREVKRTRASISSTTAEERRRLQLEARFEQMLRRNTDQIETTTPMAADSKKPLDEEYTEQCIYLDADNAENLSLPLSSDTTSKLDSSSTVCQDQVVKPRHSDTPTSVISSPIVCNGTSTSQFQAIGPFPADRGSIVAPRVTCDSITTLQPETTNVCDTVTFPCAALVPYAMGADGVNSRNDHSCDADASRGSSTTSPLGSTSLSGLSCPAALDLAAVHPLTIPEPAVMLMPSSDAALLRQFRQVKHEVIARGLGFYTRTSSNNPVRMSARKRHAGRTWEERVTRRKSTRGDVRALLYSVDDYDAEACWGDCSSDEDTAYVHVRGLSKLI